MTQLSSSPRCADGAQARGDSRAATAPPAPRLLLVEQPGPWGRDAVRESRLDPEVAEELVARAARAHARVLLIRRVGRPVTAPTRRWAVVDTRPGRAMSWWGDYQSVTELLDVPLDGSAGSPTASPAYLVCTHGRHDACCAIRGRPVAAAFAAVRPRDIWECSHVGGDRFAANVVVLPYGLYYGHVPPQLVPDLVRDTEEGLLQLPLLRGRTAFAAPVQAAQHHARLELGELRIEALAPLRVVSQLDGVWEVRLRADVPTSPDPAERADRKVVDVVVRAETVRVDARLTCGSTGPGNVHRFSRLSLAVTSGAQ